MFCSACGGRLPHDALFCGYCGFRLSPIPDPFRMPPPAPLPAVEAPPILLTQRKPLATDLRVDGSSSPRRQPRFPLRAEINYESDHNFYNGFTENISHGGVFIATHRPRPIGELIDLTFSLPGFADPLKVVGRVKWIREYNPSVPDATPGMGVEFVQLGSREQRLIEAFIRHREPIFFDA